MTNKNGRQLNVAKSAKNDEFYTLLEDIEKECNNYISHFKGKIIYCNCDNPARSEFFHYFASNFFSLGLKKLICTCYDKNFASTKISLWDEPAEIDTKKEAYKVVIPDCLINNGVKFTSGLNIYELIKNDIETQSLKYVQLLEESGDFRSDECVQLLKESDIIVTNPPFSLFREFIKVLVEYNKCFLVVGNMNASTCKEVFPLIQQNKMWYGPSISSGDRKFIVPESYPLDADTCGVDKNGKHFIRVKGVRWFTNIDNEKRHQLLPLTKTYSPDKYPIYDNYNAINVNKVNDIPKDYNGIMGVPITFLDKYNPNQFEILWIASGHFNTTCPDNIKELVGYKNILSDSNTRGYGIINGKQVYHRILIRYRRT